MRESDLISYFGVAKQTYNNYASKVQISNVIFKGVGRHSKTGKKKGGIKVHAVTHANEGVPCDVQFTSAATNDSFMLAHSNYNHNEIVALDRAYINYEQFEEITDSGDAYVTKMKRPPRKT